MKCTEFKKRIMEHISGGTALPNDMNLHIEECKECREYFEDSKSGLKCFMDRHAEPSDSKEAADFITSINPLLSKKSLQLRQNKQLQKESIALTLIIVSFLGAILSALYSYLIAGTTFLIHLFMAYTISSSIISLILAPTIKKYRRNVL